jgi:hypothetical protein
MRAKKQLVQLLFSFRHVQTKIVKPADKRLLLTLKTGKAPLRLQALQAVDSR